MTQSDCQEEVKRVTKYMSVQSILLMTIFLIDTDNYQNLSGKDRKISQYSVHMFWNRSRDCSVYKLNNSTKGRNYSIFKDNTDLENFFILLPKHLYLNMVKLRTYNHKLPVETGH